MIYFNSDCINDYISEWKVEYGKDEKDIAVYMGRLKKYCCEPILYILEEMMRIKTLGLDVMAWRKMEDFYIGSFNDFKFVHAFRGDCDSDCVNDCSLRDYFSMIPILEEHDWIINDCDFTELGKVYGYCDYSSFPHPERICENEGLFLAKLKACGDINSEEMASYKKRIPEFEIIHALAKPVLDEIYNTYLGVAISIIDITKYLLNERRKMDVYFATSEGRKHMERIVALNLENPYEKFSNLCIGDIWIDEDNEGDFCFLENEDIYSEIVDLLDAEDEEKGISGLDVFKRVEELIQKEAIFIPERERGDDGR